MTNTTPRTEHGNIPAGTLFMAFELSEKTWKLGFTTGPGQKPRARNVTARDQERVLNEIAQAKRRLGLPETAPVVSCYEAGRSGSWRSCRTEPGRSAERPCSRFGDTDDDPDTRGP